MPFCSKCGTQIDENSRFCPSCGAEVNNTTSSNANNASAKINSTLNQFTNTADRTGNYTAQEIQSGKGMGVLCYLGFLVLIPLFAAKDNRFVRFHVNQGLVLFIVEVLYGVAYSILSAILLAISWRLYLLTSILSLVSLVFFVFLIIGIVNVVNGKAKELPLIGGITLLK